MRAVATLIIGLLLFAVIAAMSIPSGRDRDM